MRRARSSRPNQVELLGTITKPSRMGATNLFIMFAPLEGLSSRQCHLSSTSAADDGQVLEGLFDVAFGLSAETFVLVQDNLSTHPRPCSNELSAARSARPRPEPDPPGPAIPISSAGAKATVPALHKGGLILRRPQGVTSTLYHNSRCASAALLPALAERLSQCTGKRAGSNPLRAPAYPRASLLAQAVLRIGTTSLASTGSQ